MQARNREFRRLNAERESGRPDFEVGKAGSNPVSASEKRDTREDLVSQTVDKVILRQRKGLGNKLFITLLRKAGFACRPFLGGK